MNEVDGYDEVVRLKKEIERTAEMRDNYCRLLNEARKENSDQVDEIERLKQLKDVPEMFDRYIESIESIMGRFQDIIDEVTDELNEFKKSRPTPKGEADKE